MIKGKLLAKIKNNHRNVSYSDFVTLVKAYGFMHTRGKGSHEIYRRYDIPKIVNIQNHKGKAKPYQVEQFLKVIEEFNLQLEDTE